jgi:putative flavoprotein involved in K+ transport
MSGGRTERVDAVIVGAGQAGLSVGYHLARRGVSFVILEANPRVGDTWRHRWDSLRLFTPARYDGLPGMPYPGPAWSFPTKDDIADFLEAYAQHVELPIRTGVRVERLSGEAPAYVVTSRDDQFEAGTVVVATGGFATPYRPEFAADLDRGIVQLHSSAYRNPSQLGDGPVLVVGAGNSGAEIALEAARAGHVTWLSGRDVGEETPFRIGTLPDRLLTPVAWWLFSRVLTTSNAVGRRLRRRVVSAGAPLVRVKRKDLAAAGVERVPRTVAHAEGRPALEDERVVSAANVIWCTGYRPDFGWIDLQVFDAHGQPRHERGVVTAQPGLYFVGLPFLDSLTSPLIGGVGRDARHIAAQVGSELARQKPQAHGRV